MGCTCQIIPPKLLKKLAEDQSFSVEERQHLIDTSDIEKQWRAARAAQASLIAKSAFVARIGVAYPPETPVYTCNHGQSLPGAPVGDPAASGDPAAAQAFQETAAVAEFYKAVFNRNSVDDLGSALVSSVHYGTAYNNAFWNGSQMVYGDGDGNIFVDFTRGTDVIGHELTHGVTQHTTQLNYTNEAGGLNESCSDVFGIMFKQWRLGADIGSAKWLIGDAIMGPTALAKDYICLRDMADPAATHCLSPQPKHYADYKPGMDPHESSGIPNYAFYLAAEAIGGNSWDIAGQIWYRAMTAYPASPNMKMKIFANRTRKEAGKMSQAASDAVDRAWSMVGL